MLQMAATPHRDSLRAGSAEPQKVFVMLKIEPVPAPDAIRPSMAVAFVLDTSGSMRDLADLEKAQVAFLQERMHQMDSRVPAPGLEMGTRLDWSLHALHSFVDDPRLTPQDRVTVICFDDEARVLLSLTPVSQRARIHEAIEGMRQYAGGTAIGKGLAEATHELQAAPGSMARRVLLLTDGETFDGVDCRFRAGRLAKMGVPIVGIGIGLEYNEELLLELTGVTQGRPYHLQSMDALPGILDNELRFLLDSVVDCQLRLTLPREVQVNACSGVYPSLSEIEPEGELYRIGNIRSGDTTVLVLEATVTGPLPLGSFRLARLSGSAECDVVLKVTADGSAEVNEEVMGYVRQRSVDRMVSEAVALSESSPEQAAARLQVVADTSRHIGHREMTQLALRAASELKRRGRIDGELRKTLRVTTRNNTIRLDSPEAAGVKIPTEAEIRRLTGA
ncbi:MAG: vWA domain-containing protein [Candidatus Xenobia bacterium]